MTIVNCIYNIVNVESKNNRNKGARMKTYDDWIAQDKNGDIYCYSSTLKYDEPYLCKGCWDGENRKLVVENFHKDIKQFIKMPGWKNSLINLSEYDFKIENFQLVRVDKKEKETQQKKEVHRFLTRICIVKIYDTYSLQMAVYKEDDKQTIEEFREIIEKRTFFYKWLGYWEEREFTI